MRKRKLTELGRFMSAKLSTSILKYPSGRYGIVGSVPIELTVAKKDPYANHGIRHDSMVWNTEEEAISALLAIGINRFQKSDCTWYEVQL